MPGYSPGNSVLRGGAVLCIQIEGTSHHVFVGKSYLFLLAKASECPPIIVLKMSGQHLSRSHISWPWSGTFIFLSVFAGIGRGKIVFPSLIDELPRELCLFSHPDAFIYLQTFVRADCLCLFPPRLCSDYRRLVRTNRRCNSPGVLSGLPLKLKPFRAFDMIRKL